MKEIRLSNITIKLDIWDELRVKDLRKIQPIISNQKPWEELEMIVELMKALSIDENVENIIDELNIADFTKLSEEITKLITPEKKMIKS